MSRVFGYAGTARTLLGKPQTRAERIVYKVVAISGICIPISFISPLIVGFSSEDGLHYTLAQRLVIGFAAISAVTFVLSLPVAGMLMLGRQAGRKNLLTQIVYVLGKVFLALLLPCLLITVLVIVIAWAATGTPPWVVRY